jgi:hypothetical protein
MDVRHLRDNKEWNLKEIFRVLCASDKVCIDEVESTGTTDLFLGHFKSK